MKLEATAFKADGNGVIISLHIQPGAKRSTVCGMYGDTVKIAVKAPPVDGRANNAVREFLADKFKLPNGAVTLVSGASGRDKRFRISGVSPEQALEILEN